MSKEQFEHEYDPPYGNPKLYCPFCERYSTNFRPAGFDIPALKENNVVGAGYRLNAKCPNCGSTDRERLIYLYLKNKTQLFYKNTKLLHVAPEASLQKVLMAKPNIEYIGADLRSPLAAVQMDITDIMYADNSFDVVICNHVLEHVPDDRKAMAELYRVLKPGGWAIAQVPISLSLSETYEDPLVVSPEDREKVFGQNDHVRLYAKDYKDRLEQVGFSVEVYSFVKEFGDSVAHKYALSEDENIYICSKPGPREEIIQEVEYQKDHTHLRRLKLLSHLIEGQKVLEIGCGNAELSAEIAKLGFEIVGIAGSEQEIRQVVELVEKQKLDAKAHFIIMDANSLEFSDDVFDTVLITKVYEHVGDSKKLLDEAVRVVRNGGRIIVSVPAGLPVTSADRPRVLSSETLIAELELDQYTEEIQWHDLPSKKWLVCSFFVRKRELDATEGPLVDIMMPTYNGRKYIRNAIKSIIDQTYHNWNLVVINDGGEDVADIINEFEDRRIKYIVTQHMGKAHALNVGIRNSSGEFIGYLDDDDILYPIHLEVLVKGASEGKKDFVYCDWYEVSLDENNAEIGREFQYRLNVAPWMLITQNYINHKCILHKRSLFVKTGTYDEELHALIDWDMIRRLSFACPPHHIWSATSERIRYYSKGSVDNRIMGIWAKDPEKAAESMERTVNKTRGLSATAEDLKEAVVRAMLFPSYYHQLEFRRDLRVRDSRIAKLETRLQEKVAHVHRLESHIYRLESQLRQIQYSIPMQLVNRYQRTADRLMPPGTRRRRCYEPMLTGIRVILNEGWRSFFRKAWGRLAGRPATE